MHNFIDRLHLNTLFGQFMLFLRFIWERGPRKFFNNHKWAFSYKTLRTPGLDEMISYGNCWYILLTNNEPFNSNQMSWKR